MKFMEFFLPTLPATLEERRTLPPSRCIRIAGSG